MGFLFDRTFYFQCYGAGLQEQLYFVFPHRCFFKRRRNSTHHPLCSLLRRQRVNFFKLCWFLLRATKAKNSMGLTHTPSEKSSIVHRRNSSQNLPEHYNYVHTMYA